MTALFTKNGRLPAAAPFSDIDAAGDTWTNLADNPLGRAVCGWEIAPPAPAFDAATQRIEWAGVGWAVIDFSVEELAARREARRQERIDELAAYRSVRQQRFTFMGQSAPADIETIALVAAKIKVMEQRGAAPEATFIWKPARATFTFYTLAQLRIYGDAIDAYVQLCFDREMDLCAELLAADDSDDVDITVGWP